MALLDDLQWRHAVKAFVPNEKVDQEKVNKIIEAARLAPTSSGLQPFRIISVSDQAIKEQLVAGALNPDCMRDCSHVLVFAGWDNYTDERIDTVFDMTTDERGLERGRFGSYTDMLKANFNGKPDKKNFAHIARQVYIGLGLALAQAAELKVHSCPAEGFNPKVVNEVLGLEKHNLKSVVLMYIGKADAEKDWLGNMKKVRIPTDEFVIKV